MVLFLLHIAIYVVFCVGDRASFLRWRKTPKHKNPGSNEIFENRGHSTPPAPEKLPAKNLFGKNLPHPKISNKKLERGKKTLQKGEWKRKGKESKTLLRTLTRKSRP